MSRINNVFLPQGVAYAQGATNSMVDLRYGGQNGYAPDLTSWVSNQAYVRKNLICLLVEAPTAFQNLDQPDYWVGTLRSLVELQALSITGLNMEMTVETSDANPVGGGGQVQEEFTNVTMQRSNPTFRWNERYGLAIYNFLTGWVRYCMMDPESKVASVNTIPGNAVPDMLADRYSATMAFIEPDPTHTKVNKAWLCTNMYPKNSIGGSLGGQRELTQGGEIGTLDIEFSCLAQQGAGVIAFCQQLLNSINITNANPYNRQAFVSQISAEVTAQSQGYSNGIDTLAANAAVV
jgi:hypothetical protein